MNLNKSKFDQTNIDNNEFHQNNENKCDYCNTDYICITKCCSTKLCDFHFCYKPDSEGECLSCPDCEESKIIGVGYISICKTVYCHEHNKLICCNNCKTHYCLNHIFKHKYCKQILDHCR